MASRMNGDLDIESTESNGKENFHVRKTFVLVFDKVLRVARTCRRLLARVKNWLCDRIFLVPTKPCVSSPSTFFPMVQLLEAKESEQVKWIWCNSVITTRNELAIYLLFLFFSSLTNTHTSSWETKSNLLEMWYFPSSLQQPKFHTAPHDFQNVSMPNVENINFFSYRMELWKQSIQFKSYENHWLEW